MKLLRIFLSESLKDCQNKNINTSHLSYNLKLLLCFLIVLQNYAKKHNQQNVSRFFFIKNVNAIFAK